MKVRRPSEVAISDAGARYLERGNRGRGSVRGGALRGPMGAWNAVKRTFLSIVSTIQIQRAQKERGASGECGGGTKVGRRSVVRGQ